MLMLCRAWTSDEEKAYDASFARQISTIREGVFTAMGYDAENPPQDLYLSEKIKEMKGFYYTKEGHSLMNSMLAADHYRMRAMKDQDSEGIVLYHSQLEQLFEEYHRQMTDFYLRHPLAEIDNCLTVVFLDRASGGVGENPDDMDDSKNPALSEFWSQFENKRLGMRLLEQFDANAEDEKATAPVKKTKCHWENRDAHQDSKPSPDQTRQSVLTAINAQNVNWQTKTNIPSSFRKWYEEPPKSSQKFQGDLTCLGCACTIPITGKVVLNLATGSSDEVMCSKCYHTHLERPAQDSCVQPGRTVMNDH